MTRIEKTQINASALISLSATLQDVQSENIIEIDNGGKSVRIRKKHEHELENFSIDLSFLEKIFGAMVTGSRAPLIFTGDAEDYLRNCSYACYYYKNDGLGLEEYDHFALFHRIHFSGLASAGSDDEILQLFCGLFKIDFSVCHSFFNSKSDHDEYLHLTHHGAFNEIFETVASSSRGGVNQIIFTSRTLDNGSSIDALYTIKDLIFGRGIDVSAIPEQHVFTIMVDEEVGFDFAMPSGARIRLKFRYTSLHIEFSRSAT